MNIGQAADATGLSAKTIRYYEDIGLINAARGTNGYRDFSENQVHTLKFIQRARSMGFSIEECKMLLSLYENQTRTSAQVKQIALNKIGEIEMKINELQELRNTLNQLAQTCHGDDRPDCPIINDLAGENK